MSFVTSGRPAGTIDESGKDDLNRVLGRLSGFDTGTALLYLNGNKDLYVRMLNRFRASYRGAGEEYYETLRKGDLEGAARMAHTLKGLSASLGAVELHDAAVALDSSFKEGGNAAPELSAACFDELAGVIAMLDSAFEEEAPDRTVKLDSVQCGPVCDCRERIGVFMELLEEGDAEACDYMRKNEEIFNALLAQNDLSLLRQHVEHYDFDAALELLKENIAGNGS